MLVAACINLNYHPYYPELCAAQKGDQVQLAATCIQTVLLFIAESFLTVNIYNKGSAFTGALQLNKQDGEHTELKLHWFVFTCSGVLASWLSRKAQK